MEMNAYPSVGVAHTAAGWVTWASVTDFYVFLLAVSRVRARIGARIARTLGAVDTEPA